MITENPTSTGNPNPETSLFHTHFYRETVAYIRKYINREYPEYKPVTDIIRHEMQQNPGKRQEYESKIPLLVEEGDLTKLRIYMSALTYKTPQQVQLLEQTENALGLKFEEAARNPLYRSTNPHEKERDENIVNGLLLNRGSHIKRAETLKSMHALLTSLLSHVNSSFV